MSKIYLRRDWEVLAFEGRIQLRSQKGAYSLYEQSNQKEILTRFFEQLGKGICLETFSEEEAVDPASLTELTSTLASLDVITNDPKQASKLVRPKESLAELVAKELPQDLDLVLSLPESGSANIIGCYHNLHQGNAVVAFGFRRDGEYELVVVTDEWWLQPLQVLHQAFRTVNGIEEAHYAWLVCQVIEWPGNQYFFTPKERSWLSSAIVACLGKRMTGHWIFCPRNRTVIKQQVPATTSQQQDTPDYYLSVLSDRFIGQRRIVAECEPISFENAPFQPTNHIFRSLNAFPSFNIDDRREERGNWGSDRRSEVARLKATMEAVERYASGMVDWQSLQNTSYDELGKLAIHPDELFASGDTVEFLEKFALSSQFSWVEAKPVWWGISKWLPMDYVYFPLDLRQLGREPLFYATSSGVAAHRTTKQAISNALAELAEREAFMVTWYNQLSRPHIDSGSLDHYNQLRLQRLQDFGYQTTLIDLTLDLMPVVLALAVGRNHCRVLAIGGGAAPTQKRAVEKAINEVETMIAIDAKYGLNQPISNPEDVLGPADHGWFYSHPSRLDSVAFLLESADNKLPVAQSRVSSYKEIFARAGLTPYYVDLTPEEILRSEIPTRIIRTVVPGMVPITFGYGLHPTGMKRLWNLPVKLDLRTDSLARRKFPPIHPFN